MTVTKKWIKSWIGDIKETHNSYNSVMLSWCTLQYLVIDDGGKTEQVKDLNTHLPHVDAPVLAQTLVVEAVDLRDLSGLVVAAY